jgi:DNA/RNA-binding domain of Phe-tRNA-synthetase-like protein
MSTYPELLGDASVAGRVRWLAIWADGADVRDDGSAYAELTALARSLGEEYAGKSPAQVQGVAVARRLYREFGIDPTRTRPSSEALLRRALRGQDLYRINNIVDLGNLASLSALLPLGLYDRSHIESSPATLRVGFPGESFPGIRKDDVHVGGRLCLADRVGAFGSPTSDSLRTSIRDGSHEILVVVFSPVEGGDGPLRRARSVLIDGLPRFCNATVVREEASD